MDTNTPGFERAIRRDTNTPRFKILKKYKTRDTKGLYGSL